MTMQRFSQEKLNLRPAPRAALAKLRHAPFKDGIVLKTNDMPMFFAIIVSKKRVLLV
jgi:hypothetical protein